MSVALHLHAGTGAQYIHNGVGLMDAAGPSATGGKVGHGVTDVQMWGGNSLPVENGVELSTLWCKTIAHGVNCVLKMGLQGPFSTLRS